MRPARLAAFALVPFPTCAAPMTFMKDASGAVTQLVLHQGGRDTPGKRLQ